jgi:hypothetical protein
MRRAGQRGSAGASRTACVVRVRAGLLWLMA